MANEDGGGVIVLDNRVLITVWNHEVSVNAPGIGQLGLNPSNVDSKRRVGFYPTTLAKGWIRVGWNPTLWIVTMI